ncbi:hypothetical protein [Qipengyuania atrilutea]|uniref:Uncharacterized protein n=1 Tax=Qipengyuania atrilutea TaxID=2744473 RepID=A0A850GX84_9SPHN|nr:hypothetical protein [Actirhodobacter atriluteus]NVD44194.1 hypothetical protein [Actirhodobacter atriluteus]
MDRERIWDAVARIERARQRISAAEVPEAGAGAPPHDLADLPERHAALQAEVTRSLARLDELIERLEE